MMHALSVLVFWGGLLIGGIMLLIRARQEGRQDAINEQAIKDFRAEQARDKLDQEVSQLSNGELNARLSRWMRDRGVDPSR
jgi:hypothetical protein